MAVRQNQDLQDYEDLHDWYDADASFYGYCLEASMTTPDRHSRVGGNLQGGARQPRHCGLDPQSRGAGTQGGRHTGFKAVSTGRGT